MSTWQYCYAIETLTPSPNGLVRDWFVARPDRAEENTEWRLNEVLWFLGQEGWELVSVTADTLSYSEQPITMGGIPRPSHVSGQSDVSSRTFYFKRPQP